MPTTYADFNDFNVYWGTSIEERNQDQINRYLVMAASNIQAALSAAGAEDCAKADWATEYLKNLNVVLAGALYPEQCGVHLNTDEKRLYLEWANNELSMIRDGSQEVCDGETGKNFASIDWAEQSVDEFSAAKIIVRDL